MEGILQLFAADGSEIKISDKHLLKLEAQNGGIKAHRRILGDTPGTYWLLSARPGHVRMILEIKLHHGHVTKEWGLGWCTNGIASYPHWNLEAAVNTFTNEHRQPAIGTDPYRSVQLPRNVEQLVREHVYYVPDAQGLSDVRPQFAVQTVSADKAKERLAKVTTADTSELISELAGRQVEIMELMLTLTFFCEENEGASGKEMALARALTKQHIKLFFLTRRLSAQLAQG